MACNRAFNLANTQRGKTTAIAYPQTIVGTGINAQVQRRPTEFLNSAKVDVAKKKRTKKTVRNQVARHQNGLGTHSARCIQS